MIDCDILVTPDIAGLSLRLLKEERAHNAKDGTRNIYIHFRRIYSNETGVARRPHPAVMLLSKQAYWMSGGCDEDFVGNYGKTDPHFKWRASRTNNVASIGGLPKLLSYATPSAPTCFVRSPPIEPAFAPLSL